MCMKTGQRKRVFELYDQMKAKKLKMCLSIHNLHLEAAMRLDNSDRIVESLDRIAEMKMQPKRQYLKVLGQTKDLPDRVFVALQKFHRFAYAVRSRDRFTAASFRPRKGEPLYMVKRTGHRYKIKKGPRSRRGKNLNFPIY